MWLEFIIPYSEIWDSDTNLWTAKRNFVCLLSEMVSGLRVEDRLDGAANYCSWRARIILLLEENELLEVVENTPTYTVVVLNPTIDLVAYTAFHKKDVKARRTILDAVKDHIIPHIGQLARAFEMWDSLTKTYQSSNENRKMVLREKLKCIQMGKNDTVTFYLTQFKQVRDELAAVGDSVLDAELVKTTLFGVAPSWAILVQAIVGRENMSSWDRLWG